MSTIRVSGGLLLMVVIMGPGVVRADPLFFGVGYDRRFTHIARIEPHSK